MSTNAVKKHGLLSVESSNISVKSSYLIKMTKFLLEKYNENGTKFAKTCVVYSFQKVSNPLFT